MSLPAYTMGQVGLLDFAPIQNALGQAIQNRQFNQRNALDQQRMGMEQERLGFERQRMEQEARLAPLRLTMEQQRLDALREEMGFKRQHFPTQLETERQRLADMRDESQFRRELRPYELRAAERKSEIDPLMIVPDGASVLNRQTGQVSQPTGQSWSKLPEFAAKSAAFASRMVEAERNVRTLLSEVDARRNRQEKGFDPTSADTAVLNMAPEALANFARSPEHQKYRQAAEQWIRAFLRKESGAAISKDEFARDFVVYFPQPGDSPEVIRQKERARLEAKKGFVEETRNYFAHVNPRGQQQINSWYSAIDQLPPMQRDMQDRGTQPAAGPREFVGPTVNSGPGIPVAPERTAAPPSPAPAPLPKEQRVFPKPTPEIVDELMRFNSPADRESFDRAFGPGAADAYLKGRR